MIHSMALASSNLGQRMQELQGDHKNISDSEYVRRKDNLLGRLKWLLPGATSGIGCAEDPVATSPAEMAARPLGPRV